MKAELTVFADELDVGYERETERERGTIQGQLQQFGFSNWRERELLFNEMEKNEGGAGFGRRRMSDSALGRTSLACLLGAPEISVSLTDCPGFSTLKE